MKGITNLKYNLIQSTGGQAGSICHILMNQKEGVNSTIFQNRGSKQEQNKFRERGMSANIVQSYAKYPRNTLQHAKSGNICTG